MDPRTSSTGSSNTGSSSSGRAAYYARLLPHTKRTTAAATTTPDDLSTHHQHSQNAAVAPALQQVLVPENAFYRVLKESKLYSITSSSAPASASTASDESDSTSDSSSDASLVVVVQEITKHGARTSSSSSTTARNSNARRNSVYDPNAFSLKKMPDEIVASSGRFECLFGAQHARTTFIQLQHVEFAYMIVSICDTAAAAADSLTASPPAAPALSMRTVRSNSLRTAEANVVPLLKRGKTIFLKRVVVVEHRTAADVVNDNTNQTADGINASDSSDDDDDVDSTVTCNKTDAVPLEVSGRFYYRVLVPIEVRKAPDLLAPILSRHLYKNAEEIIECCELYRAPESTILFVKLAFEAGWLFETLNSGIKVLERLATEPAIETGSFYYVVRIPVGIRVAPNIMAQRAGKGYKLHSIVEATQRFTPPGSKITYVRVCRSSRCSCQQSHSRTVSVMTNPDDVTSDSVDVLPSTSACHGGWLFETTMDGHVVLERMQPPRERTVERLFYRVLEDVAVLPTPAVPTFGGSPLKPPTSPTQRRLETKAPTAPASPTNSMNRKKRLQHSLIECSERLVPATNAPVSDAAMPRIAFVKLRHDVGWIAERSFHPPFPIVLEQVQGFAVTRDRPKFYRVVLPVALRSAPDFDCPRLPGVTQLPVGCVFESCLQYTPPGSSITYVKVAHELAGSSAVSTSTAGVSTSNSTAGGWLFDTTPSGDCVLEPVDDEPQTTDGRFYFRTIVSKEVLLSPEPTSDKLKLLPEGFLLATDGAYTMPQPPHLTFVRLAKEPGWIQLDAALVNDSSTRPDTRTLVRISEAVYNLYTMPPSWVSVGFPNRLWVKVPDETCRTVLADETLLQIELMQQRNRLATTSQGRDDVAISRTGILTLSGSMAAESERASEAVEDVEWRVTLEEIKHAASALLFTFPWKQIWWILDVPTDSVEEPEKHCVELQHGLRGGFRAILFDGDVLHQTRSVSDMLWDAGSEFSFTWQEHVFRVVITLEGAFFSQYLQFYSYELLVDEEAIVPVPF